MVTQKYEILQDLISPLGNVPAGTVNDCVGWKRLIGYDVVLENKKWFKKIEIIDNEIDENYTARLRQKSLYYLQKNATLQQAILQIVNDEKNVKNKKK
jgi:hypothetical protein